MRGSHFLRALGAPAFALVSAASLATAFASPALADDPRDPAMTPEAIARDKAIIRKLNQDQLAYVRQRDARYAKGWQDYRQSRGGDDDESDYEEGGYQAGRADYARQSRDYAQARRDYEADLAQWRRDVAACRAGNYSRCR